MKGVKRVKGVLAMAMNEKGDRLRGDAEKIECDLLAVSGGWNPAVHLHSQSGGEGEI